MYIIVIEDNVRMLDNINYILKKENYHVDTASNGDDGYNKIISNSYDLVILDLMIPGMNGFEIIEALRMNSNKVPILVLSAKSQTDDKVKALDLGCDDYLTKPFAPAELLARIRTLLRRKYDVESSVITIGDMVIDIKLKEITINGEKLELTSKEYELLEFLAYNKGNVVTRVAIGEHIWGETLDLFTMSNFIDVHIKNLRKKISNVTVKQYIHTKRGVGFIIKEE